MTRTQNKKKELTPLETMKKNYFLTTTLNKEFLPFVNQINANSLQGYIQHHKPEKLSIVIARLLIYALEDPKNIYLNMEETDELKGLIQLLNGIIDGKEYYRRCFGK